MSSRHLLWSFAVFFLVVGVLLAVTAHVFCQATLHVQRRPVPLLSIVQEKHPEGIWHAVSIQAKDGAHLHGWFAVPAVGNHSCAIVLHGIADSRAGSAGFASPLLQQGYAVLTPDSRGHGESEGEFVTYGLQEKVDVLLWMEWLRKAGCHRFYGLGESLGASILIQAAALDPVFSAIVAECPYADLQSIAKHRTERQLQTSPAWIVRPAAWTVVETSLVYALWRYGLDLRKVSPKNDMRTMKTPVLLIHGIEDWDTPIAHSRLLASVNRRARLWLVPAAGHVAAARFVLVLYPLAKCMPARDATLLSGHVPRFCV